MHKIGIVLILLFAFLLIDCEQPSDEELADAAPEDGAAGEEDEVGDDPYGLKMEVWNREDDPQLAKELDSLRDFEQRMKDGTAEEVEDSGESAYQLTLPTRPRPSTRNAGVLLGRMAVSEGVGLQPLKDGWDATLQGILQVARNNQRPGERLWNTLARLSPHVARVKQYSEGQAGDRQGWTSTLQGRGDAPPELWVECTSWYLNDKGRKRGLPEGCAGVWKHGAKNWVKVRSYAIELVRMESPPEPVMGTPTTWGGVMDIWVYLRRHPGACWLESPGSRNYFFGQRGREGNVCKEIPRKLVDRSKTVSASIMMRDLKRLKRADRARRAARSHP